VTAPHLPPAGTVRVGDSFDGGALSGDWNCPRLQNAAFRAFELPRPFLLCVFFFFSLPR